MSSIASRHFIFRPNLADKVFAVPRQPVHPLAQRRSLVLSIYFLRKYDDPSTSTVSAQAQNMIVP